MNTTSNPQDTSPSKPARRRRWPTAVAFGALVAAVGVGSFAFGAGMPWHGGWSAGAKLAMVQYRVRASLDSVGATAEQEAQVHDIVARTAADLERNGFDRDAVRKQMLALLRAPKLDPAAIETLRARQIAKLDTLSKTMTGALVDAAQQLSADQRGKLADSFEAMARHRPWQRPGARFDDGAKPGTDPAAPVETAPDAAAPDHG